MSGNPVPKSLPGHSAAILGLTGARLRAADAFYCGFATHVVAQERVEALVTALAGTAWATDGRSVQVATLLAEFAGDPGLPPLAALRPAIDRCFAGDNVEAVLDRLAAEAAAGGADAGWAAETRAGLLTKSPTSLKVTLRQLIEGQDYGVEPALEELQYRLTQHFMAAHDFYEGARAVLIHKGQTLRWRPPTLAEINDEMLEAYFAPIGDRELRFDD